MNEHSSSTTVENVFAHAEKLSTSHTVFVFPEEDLGEWDPDYISENVEPMILDIGHYKESDIAVWSVMRIIDRRAGTDGSDVTRLLISRIRRTVVSEGTIDDPLPVDVLCLTRTDEDDYEVIHFQGDTVTTKQTDFKNADFWPTQRAIFQLQEENRMSSTLNDPTITVGIQRTSFQGETLDSAVTDSATQELMRSLLKLGVDDRYVTRFASEREFVQSRPEIIELIASLDDLHANLEAGVVVGDRQVALNDDGTVAEEAWSTLSPTGLAISLTKVPRDKVMISSDKTDAKITNSVEPPTDLPSPDDTKDYSYRIYIYDPIEDIRRSFHVSGSHLTAQYNQMLSQEYHEVDGAQTGSEITQMVDWSNLINGRVYLAPTDVESLIEIINDTNSS